MRQRRTRLVAAVAVVAAGSVIATTAVAGGGRDVREELSGVQEVPVVLTGAEGSFTARVRSDRIDYTLSYEDLEGGVTQAHIHVGQRLANGGISVWLCGNPSATVNPPAGTPACPSSPATVTETITADDVVGPTNQGIAPREFGELVEAIRDGFTYANVHTTLAPGGEIRGQLRDRGREDN